MSGEPEPTRADANAGRLEEDFALSWDASVEPGMADSGGRYVRLRLHDQGGMGRVWVARDTDLDRDVALKELRPEQVHNEVALARFLREARITGQLEHPGIVPVYE